MKIGDRIKKIRIDEKISQKSMAKMLDNMPVSTLANYENNHREPTLDTLNKIACVLDAPLIDFLDISINQEKDHDMVNPRAWQEFRNTGLFWWINMILHTFGWSIVMDMEKDGTITKVYPARVKFRGFDLKSNDEGYQKVSEYMKENADILNKEAHEQEVNNG